MENGRISILILMGNEILLLLIISIFFSLQSSLSGIILLSLRIPFLSLIIAHIALLGGAAGILTGVDFRISSAILTVISSILIFLYLKKNYKREPSELLSFLFSTTLALSFLLMGFVRTQKGIILNFLWGNIFLIKKIEIFYSFLIFFCLVLFVMFFKKFIIAESFSPLLSRFLNPKGIPLLIIILLLSLFFSFNLQLIGGLFLYSLTINPAIFGIKIGKSFFQAIIFSMFAGIFSVSAGFFLSYYLKTPFGASCAFFSSVPGIYAFFKGRK